MSSLLASAQLLLRKPAPLQLLGCRTFTSWRVGHTVHGNAAANDSSCITNTKNCVLQSGASVCSTGSLWNNPWSSQSYRFYNKRKTVKLPYTKPLRMIDNLLKCDANLSMAPMDKTQPKLAFEEVGTLESADENVKKIFSLAFGTASDANQKRLDLVVKTVQEHPADVRSYEVKIARQTLQIRNQANHLLQFRKDKIAKVYLNKKIGKRGKTLRILRNTDKEKFDWLCAELDITYTPPLEFRYGKIPSKRAMRRKIAREKFFEIKHQKLQDFQAKLDQTKIEFAEKKAAELALIKEELKAFDITEMSSVDQVIRDLGLGKEHLIAKPRLPSRRQQLLHKKFELYKGGANLYKYNRQKPSQK